MHGRRRTAGSRTSSEPNCADWVGEAFSAHTAAWQQGTPYTFGSGNMHASTPDVIFLGWRPFPAGLWPTTGGAAGRA